MGKHSALAGKNKVYIPRADIVANRDAVDFWLGYFGYPALLSAKALESLIFRERKAKEARERACRTSD
jgi:hypothetical protein